MLFLSIFGLLTQASSAGVTPPPGPPEKNPHPPITEKDKARVAFAVEAAKLLLVKKREVAFDHGAFGNNFSNKTLECLKKPSCWQKDMNFKNELNIQQHGHGFVTEMRYAHIIPWSFKNFEKGKTQVKPTMKQSKKRSSEPMPAPKLKPDEYMIHIYANFDKYGGRWYHLDVILHEDKVGNLFLRHFFMIPIPYANESMPEGAVCWFVSSLERHG